LAKIAENCDHNIAQPGHPDLNARFERKRQMWRKLRFRRKTYRKTVLRSWVTRLGEF
jgi:hypothetical protein